MLLDFTRGGCMSKDKLIVLIALHLILAIYSISGIFSKMAAQTQFLDLEFCLYYGGIIILLGAYAFVWQQIIKRLPLTVAFANKAVIVVWGIIWGIIIFNETVTIRQLFGAALIMAGIVLYSMDLGKEEECQS